MKRILATIALLLPTLALGQGTPGGPPGAIMANPTASYGPMIPTNGTANATSINVNGYVNAQGLVNVCNFSTVANGGSGYCGDTIRNNEVITCTASGGTTVVSGLTQENLTGSPYVGANAVIGGCGYYSAKNAVGGIAVSAAGTGYAGVTNSAPHGVGIASGTGDLITLTDGTPTTSFTFTASMAASTGILTVTGTPGGTIVPGLVITGTSLGNSVVIMTQLSASVAGTGGGAGTYLTTYTGGSISSETMTATSRTTLKVLTVSSGAIVTAAVVGGGSYSVKPSGTATVTSGSGSGAQFTGLTWGGWPLQGQVTAVGTGVSAAPCSGVTNSCIQINVACTNCVSATSEWWAVGHDDAPAINAALATNPSGIYLPPLKANAWSGSTSTQFSQYSQITSTYQHEFIFACNGESINALAPMNAQIFIQFNAGPGLFYIPANNEINDCYLEGFAQAQYNIQHMGASWRFLGNMMRDALDANFWLGDGVHNAENNSWVSDTAHNDLTVIPAAGAYNFYFNNGATDNQSVNLFADTAVWANMEMQGPGTFINTSHVYLTYAGPEYDVEGSKMQMNNFIGDQPPPGYAMTFANGAATEMNGWQVWLPTSFNGQYGIFVNTGIVEVGCGQAGITAIWSGNSANVVAQNGTLNNVRIAPCILNGDQPVVAAYYAAPTTNGGTAVLNSKGTSLMTIGNVTDGTMARFLDCAGTCVNAIQFAPSAEGTQANMTVYPNQSGTTQPDLSMNYNAANALASSGLNGGAAYLNGGNGDANTAASTGGSANVVGGTGSTNGSATGVGGAATLVGGPGGANNAAGGAVTIKGGAGNGTGAYGAVNIATPGGIINIGGAAASGNQVNIGGTSGATSAVSLNVGASTGGVHIDDGTGTGAVTIGNSANLTKIGPLVMANGTTATIIGPTTGCSGTNGSPGAVSGSQQGGTFTSNSSGTGCVFQITVNGATGATAPHAWICFGSDTNTGVPLAQSGTPSNTYCKLTGTVNATTDTISFMAIGN